MSSARKWLSTRLVLALVSYAGCLLPEVGRVDTPTSPDDGAPKRRGQAEAAEMRDTTSDATGDDPEASAQPDAGTASSMTQTPELAPCQMNNGGCDTSPLAKCASRAGVVTGCSFPGGYEGDGMGAQGCTDIDECATSNGGCDDAPNATCSNRMGAAPSCRCPSGSTGDGVGSDGCTPAVCVDYRCDTDTVYDAKTSLTWQRTLPGLYDGCTGRSTVSAAIPGDACTWENAKRCCSKLGLAGGSWRLPTKDELMSLVKAGSANPAIEITAFPDTPAEPFWTGSPYTASMGYAWTVFFSNIGGTYYYQTSNAYRVRCVR